MRKKHWISGLLTSLLLCGVAQSAPVDPGYLPGDVIVKFAVQIAPQDVGGSWRTGLTEVDAFLAGLPPVLLQRELPAVEDGNPFGLDRIWLLKFSPSTNVLPIIENLSAFAQVAYAEPRYIRTTFRNARGVAPQAAEGTSGPLRMPDGADEVPNDPSYAQQWALPKIHAAQAWDYTHGSVNVKIAITDVGTQLDHPDLQANIWNNAAELSGVAGVDDDGNGFIDDFSGWDFMDNDGYPNPSGGDSHGSHTAGSASAVTNNGIGVAGVGWSCKIMAVRVGSGSSVYYGMNGINYAALTGADVISCSWGGGASSQYEQDVINDATQRGSLVVASAGNDASSAPSYPAAYENVTSVAATNTADQRSGYSNFGTWVDLCAPGDIILSTVPGGYGYMSGTSMSCPHVAGLAGLVVAQHPTWPPDQIEAQILSTCDDISAQNPGYIGMLGAGRINAFRAVTESNPYLVISDQGFVDGDGDGLIEPGESVDFWVEFTNLLNPVNGVQAEATTTDPYATVTQANASFGDLPSGGSASNQASPFTFTVSPSAPSAHQINFTLHITGSGGYSSARYVSFTVLPVYGDLDVGNVVLTITNFGAMGYYDYANTGNNIGSGFQYPAGTASALFHGSLLVGVSSSQVSDNCYGNDANDRYDFVVTPGGDLVIGPGTQSDQEGLANFNDAASVPPVGVQVTQRGYAWADSPDDDFVIMRFDVTNTTAATLNNVRVGVYLDWDVGDYSQNTAGWDADSAVGFTKNNTSPYYGLCVVSDEASSYRVVQNSVYVYPPAVFSDAVKWGFMTEGFRVVTSSGPNDWSIMLSAGPYTIEPGAAQVVAFALLGGNDLNDLRQNVGEARLRWNDLILSAPLENAGGMLGPQDFMLERAYPNPFNAATTLRFALPTASPVKLQIYSLAGELMATLVDGYRTAGEHEVTFKADEIMPSGIYFVKLEAGSYRGIQKITLLK